MHIPQQLIPPVIEHPCFVIDLINIQHEQQVQQLLFKHGYSWVNGGVDERINSTHAVLYIHTGNKTIFWRNTSDGSISSNDPPSTLFVIKNATKINLDTLKVYLVHGVLPPKPEYTFKDANLRPAQSVPQYPRTAGDIADAALQHVRDRAVTYDQANGERSAGKTATAFNAITGKDLTEADVWLLLQLLKDVRQWSKEAYHQDSAEDCIAYAALKAEALEQESAK